ncbi:MAG: hypothetical protein IKT08_04700 [Bacteroidales bacterium]|nr:hypothetical protein [Bacteroidales bacterium]
MKRRYLLFIALAGVFALASCNKDDDNNNNNQGEAIFTASMEQMSTRTTLVPGNVVWKAGDRMVLANADHETSVFTLQSGEGTAQGTFATTNDFNTVGPFIAAYPSTAQLEGDRARYSLPATQTIAEDGNFGEGTNLMLAYSNDRTLSFKNLCGGLGIRLKGDGTHVSAVRVISKNSSEKLWGGFEVNQCNANEPVLLEASGSQGTNEVTVQCNLTLSAEASTVFVMLPPGTLASGFTVEVLDGTMVLATKVMAAADVTVVRNTVKYCSDVLVEMPINGNVEIPNGMVANDIIVTNFVQDAIPDENGDFAIGTSTLLMAKNAENGKMVYLSLHSIERDSKRSSEEPVEVSAKETALYIALRLLPFNMLDGNDEVLQKMKESVADLPCVLQLEESIRNTVNSLGYLDEEAIQPAVRSAFDFFYNELSAIDDEPSQVREPAASTELDPPYFNPNHSHGVRLVIQDSEYLENPQRWMIKCNGYSAQFTSIGIVEGYKDENTGVFIPKEGAHPYYMPPMGTSQFVVLAEQIGFLTMPGNWLGYLQLYREIKRVINDPEYLLELTHVSYENMTFEVPRTVNSIGFLSPKDDDTACIWAIVYMLYDGISLIPGVGLIPIESITDVFLHDGAFVDLVRVQSHNGIDGWTRIVEAANAKMPEVLQTVLTDYPFELIMEAIPGVGSVCSGLDLFLDVVTFAALNTFTLPVVADFPVSEAPTVSTDSIRNITGNSAVVYCTVVSEGSHTISERGICYSTHPNPTVNDICSLADIPVTVYTAQMEGLENYTKYYVKAYAKNWLGFIGYGQEFSFMTANLPTVTTLEIPDALGSTAVAQAQVTFSNLSEIKERGFLYDTSPEGLFYGSIGCDAVVYQGNSPDNFSCEIHGLQVGEDYYVKAYAKTLYGVGYGDVVNFHVYPAVPILTTYPVEESSITSSSVVLKGKVEGSPTLPIQKRGFCYSKSPYVSSNNPGVTIVEASGSGLGEFTATVNGLEADQTYYFVSYIQMQDGEPFHGPELHFHTLSNGGGGGGDNPDNPSGTLAGAFSINATQQVIFSQGNLQYQASSNTWRFAENQWDIIGSDNNGISSTYNGWIDLFGWATSGYNHGATCYQPWSTSMVDADYYAYGQETYDLEDLTGQADWGYNAISNGGNSTHTWRTPTKSEWDYILVGRTTPSGIRFAVGQVNGVNGVILLPDAWSAAYYSLNNTNQTNASYTSNVISAAQWSVLETNGAVFLPAGGTRYGSSSFQVGTGGYYWSSTHSNASYSHSVYFGTNGFYMLESGRFGGKSVRLVRQAR